MAKMKNERMDICYLCGKEGIMTDDHVPPRCLAPKADDSIFSKLPAHESCNKAFSVQESRFRDYVAAYAQDGVPEAEDAFEKMWRNFGRGKEKRSGLPNKDFYRLYNNVVLKEGYTPSGIYIGPVIGIRPRDGRRGSRLPHRHFRTGRATFTASGSSLRKPFTGTIRLTPSGLELSVLLP